KVFVAELVAMVGSSSNGNGANGNAKPVAQRRRTQLHHTSPHLPAHAGNGGKAKGNRKAKAEMPAGAVHKTDSEAMIPLDRDFADF
ncbi:hypothetical protein, partial [Desulfosarcina sp.]|uniref:hypothetical protein n=1 Tax=Desulfosarcina sp. TaxID=2027861 RepID=UPI0039710B22